MSAGNVDVRVENGVVTLSGTVATDVPSDAELRDDVADNLEWDTRVDAQDVEVLVDDREVTLAGTVDSYTEKQYAETDAWTVPGVRSVRNELTVIGEIESTDDGYIKAAVRDALSSHAGVRDEDIEVDVDVGLVTLSGTVPTLWQKSRAEELATEVVGVVGIENQLAVVPTEDILDETIAENIIHTIDRKAAVDVADVNVRVRDGVVTLSGTVPSKVAHDAAYEAALFTYGVTEIEDRLTVRKIGSG